MAIIRLDKQGRLILPAELIGSHHWRAGTEFSIEDRPDGLLLRPLRAHPKSARPRPTAIMAVPAATARWPMPCATATPDWGTDPGILLPV